MSMPLIVVAAVAEWDGRVMICQRRAEAHNGLKWEFPGGKIEAGESPEDALRRELAEELGVEARIGRICDAVFYRYADRDVLVLFYHCEILSGEPRTLDCNAVEWAAMEDLKGYDFAGADAVFVERNFKQ